MDLEINLDFCTFYSFLKKDVIKISKFSFKPRAFYWFAKMYFSNPYFSLTSGYMFSWSQIIQKANVVNDGSVEVAD